MNTVTNQQPISPKRLTTRGIIFLSCAGAAALLLLLFVICAFRVPKDTVANGVYADGIHLGGMTAEQARETLAGHDFYGQRMISVVCDGQSASVSPAEISLTTDITATVQQAYDVGKNGNIISNTFRFIGLMFRKYTVVPVSTANHEQLDAFLLEFGTQINGMLKEHEVIVENDDVRIIPGQSGQSDDVEQARNTVLKHLEKDQLENIHITLNKKTPQKFSADTLQGFVHRGMQDAYYKVENNVLSVVPEVTGIDVDEQEAKEKADLIREGGEPVIVKITKTMPAVTADMLRSKIFTGTLAEYSTRYNAKQENRSRNVALAAQKINGTILAPGDVFSYNDVVGRRTTANGFLNAPVYENGKSVDGIGGGVCQVSTTLYSAVLYADLGVVSRTNHSLTVSYVPLGQDATVADGSIDFKFRNTTDYPVKIQASAAGGVIHVALIGTPVSNKEVKLHHELVSSTDAGKTIVSTKTVYENGVKVSEKSLGKSFYKNKEKPTPSPSPTPAAPPAAAVPGTPAAPVDVPVDIPPAAPPDGEIPAA